jgi:hypothetical protein
MIWIQTCSTHLLLNYKAFFEGWRYWMHRHVWCGRWCAVCIHLCCHYDFMFYSVSIRSRGKNLLINNFAFLKHWEIINMCSVYVSYMWEILYISVCFTSGKWNVREVCQIQGIPLGDAWNLSRYYAMIDSGIVVKYSWVSVFRSSVL